MNVVCFGDSNTYGYDPRSWIGGRYDPDSRWVDILAANTGWTVHNMGQNGREIPHTPPVFPQNTHLLILMLGTNDLLQGRSPQEAAETLQHFVSGLSLDRKHILLIAPPPMALGDWVPNEALVQQSRQFARLYRDLATELGTLFADAGNWNVSLAYDGVHFTPQGHRAFAAGLLEALSHIIQEE